MNHALAPLHAFHHPLAPIARCLSLSGRAMTAEELQGDDPFEGSLSDVANLLARRGIGATTRRIDDGGLRYLRTPAIVTLEDGELAIVREIGPTQCTLEGKDGAIHSVDVAATSTRVGPIALEIDGEPHVARDTGLFALLARALLSEPEARRAALHLIALAVAENLLGLMVPVLTGWTLTRALPDGARSTLLVLALATGGVAAQQSVVTFLRSRTTRYVELKAQEKNLALAFRRLLALPFAQADAANAGELHGAIHATEALPSILVGRIALPAIDGLLAFTYVALLAGALAWAGVILMVATIVCLASSAITAHLQAKHDGERIAASSRQRSILFELLRGMSTLRAASAERPRAAAWLGAVIDERATGLRGALVGLTHSQVVEGVTNLLSGVLLLWGGQICLDGALEVGALVASLQACTALWSAVSQGLRIPMAIVAARALMKHAQIVQPKLDDAPSPLANARVAVHAGGDAIVVRGLWFRHSKSAPWLFSGLDLRVPHGENVRVSWPSGAGKSSLLRLLAGLYEPERGTVSLFGRDATSARDLVAYVPQTSFLFAGSVLANLRILSGNARVERIFAAASVTGLDEVLARWPMGMETFITEGGSNVSSGQKQLITLTAAVASERPILLLDESTAHLDRIAQARLESCNAFAGRTVVTVVHDIVAAPE